jgi:hypothetical protein
MAKHRVVTTDADIEHALQVARQQPSEPRLRKAHYSAGVNVLILNFDNDRRFAIPREDIEELRDARQKDVASIEIIGNGTGLHWPTLDFDLYIPQLLRGVYGSRRWMSTIGRKGGLATTAAKRTASRMNGTRGGRPLKLKAAAMLSTKDSSSKNLVHA